MRFKSYFNFNRNEKVGVVALSCVIIGLTIVLNVGSSMYVPDPFDVDQSKLTFLTLKESDSNKTEQYNYNADFSNTKSRLVINDFDPNKIQLEEWVELGFSQKQAESIVSYRERFGPFKEKEELKKIYVISAEKYNELAPHIQIENQKEVPSIYSTNRNPIAAKAPLIIELNTATLGELIQLKGIGEGYANRIINYREKIGGFIEIEQLDKLSISDEAKAILHENGIIDPSKVVKTNVNSATKEELKRIPFSNWTVVALILKQRELAPILNLDFLSEKEISTENRLKFESYITF